MYKRSQFSLLSKRLQEPRLFIQAVIGPRQVGKSTLVKQVLQEIGVPYTFESADAISPDDEGWLPNLWESARARMRFGNYREYLLVIDEIHKIKDWSNQVKREWDSDTFHDVNLKVVVLGSSRLLLKSGLNESLAGRFELIRMAHWSFSEMRDAFGWTLENYIYYGGYPGGAPLADDESRWKRYMRDAIVNPSIEKDVLQTKVIYKSALIKRLFELGCGYSGEELSLNKVLGQLQDVGNVTTLAAYLDTLSEAELLCGMQKYANDGARKYNSIPKFMVYNPALFTVQLGKGLEKELMNPERWGRWVETAVGAHLLCHAEEFDYKVYYWRENSLEVDFILQQNDKLIAIEVKSGRRTTNEGLPAFRKKYHPSSAFVVGSGGVSTEEFLLLSPEKIFL
ncbi:ATP-binding protein [Bacteroides heparinolyticus]|uniref:ATP-binding protein n=1 Tax=Prevotella heparinolytica TaxID=28113 RepID=A0A3P2A7R7_9BACE|nr:ATP-binding protein [Bacteroides heparinolyticus]RRD91421.1 ATP-binding protein [Bacteroides heparinolyticus]